MAQIRMDSSKLYRTVARRSCFSSSFARAHGIVSSMYLFVRLKTAKISSKASPTLNSSIFCVTLSNAATAICFNSSSTSSFTSGFVMTPLKYLLDIEMVL